ncbi:hypothetical protein Ciccas_006106 [Cichlidogyrus casuarinus]|uniref:Uncharacterized protein n=1 Tax=Cichlidogyrus casuarinus TaxID=1844966 RepID=A0ABD2Q6Q8_9PLAT
MDDFNDEIDALIEGSDEFDEASSWNLALVKANDMKDNNFVFETIPMIDDSESFDYDAFYKVYYVT